MFVILNWWYDQTIANGCLVMKDDGSGETITFDTYDEAEKYAKEELNGYWKIVEE